MFTKSRSLISNERLKIQGQSNRYHSIIFLSTWKNVPDYCISKSQPIIIYILTSRITLSIAIQLIYNGKWEDCLQF